MAARWINICAALLVLSLPAFLSGCGSGGYAGGGITSLSSSSITIDAGQSVGITASISGNETPSWALTGTSCSGTTCGALSASTGADVTYTAPSGITSQLQITLTASIANTSNSRTVSITVNPDPTISGTLPAGTVGTDYSATLKASGGTGTLTLSLGSGSLPAGLTFNATTGVISGTPTTAGTSSFVLQVVDQSDVPYTAKVSESITISSSGTTTGTLSLTGGPQPAGTVGVAYTTSLTATGGVTPYAWSIASGTLPAGLTISASTGVISGVPTASGSSSFVVEVTDSTGATATASASITINTSGTSTLTLTTTTLPSGTVGVPYSGTIGATGGTAPYSCAIASGTLPNGLILNGCTVSGTPTTAGTSTVTVTVTDSSSPANSVTGPETIVIAPAALTLTTTTLPDGTVNVPYSATIGASGGTAPYTCKITSGILPAGLSLVANSCTVSGTPTTPGSSTVTVVVTDSGSPAKTATGPETITINAAGGLTITTTTLPNGTINVPYSATIGASGGTAPYTCKIASGALPAGLSFVANSCTVSGTPTKVQTSTVSVTVTDSSSPAKSVTGPETITINSAGALSLTATLPNAIVNQPYSYTFQATGGTPPYTSYEVTTGAPPAGITLATDGTLTGTPTATGASSFTVTVTDSAKATASVNVVLLVVYQSSPNDSELKGPYAYLFQGYDDVVAGVLAYQTASVGSFTADGLGGITAGELDSNHQSSTVASGTTVPEQTFLGTYIVNSNSQGFITITTLNSDGTTNQTFTYAISLKAPVSPATVSTEGSLIEYDNNQLVGTKGSGSLLAQTTSTFSAGLKGSYAFGLSGDTPCLVSCTLGIGSGPVATVGQFTTNGSGTISSGSADANIASSNFPNAPLSGSYETADANGRMTMELINSSISDGVYPTDYAVYIVNANQAFVMSTDVHSTYTLLAGTAQLQSTTSFDNTSLSGPFIGYENAQTDPGLLGATLQSVLNFSSATIFRVNGAGDGTCDTTNVDTAGLTGLVDNLTGIANVNLLLQGLLGNATSTGTANCQVASNGRAELYSPQPSSLISAILALLGLASGPPAPRIVYLTSQGTGYFLESSYAGLGHIEQQTGAPFSLATLDGTYVDSTIPASSLASITTSGYFTAYGNGNATYNLTANIGVGTLNILQLGTTTNTTYALNDPNTNTTAATAGRYLLGDGTTVIYAISPDRFVLLNTSVLTTSPSVSLIY